MVGRFPDISFLPALLLDFNRAYRCCHSHFSQSISLSMLLDLAPLDFPPSHRSLPTVISDAAASDMCSFVSRPSILPPLLSTVISGAAAGGQVLLCSTTFKAVKELARDLGCVTKDGMQVDQLHQAVWWQFWR